MPCYPALVNSDALLNRDALLAELDAAKPRRVLLNCAIFALAAVLVCLFLWLVLLYKRAGGFSAEMVWPALLVVPVFAAMMVPSFKLHRLEERCKQIKAQLLTPTAEPSPATLQPFGTPAEPSPAPLQPFGTTGELERLETRLAALSRTGRILRFVTAGGLVAPLVYIYFMQEFLQSLPQQKPLPPELRTQLLNWAMGFGALVLPFLGLGAAVLIYNIRIKRLREELEHRRMVPR
ncbi:MAG: hypothetical protein HPKKFMNG_01718 [Planctomycetes bacterium]|nr:hypothetical protein [Planctomycetota bacterium]